MGHPQRFLLRLQREWRATKRRHPRLVIGVAVTVAFLTVVSVAGSVWFLASLLRSLPDEEAIGRIGEMDQATRVYDASDHLAFTIYKEQRIEVPHEQMSLHLIDAIVAIEDQRFYEHGGFDAVRIGAAALANLRRFRVAQGGSTITQQLARQSFLTPAKTIRRKLQELIVAARIERRYSKARILELYLNKVYFGAGLYGAEAASQGYFGKRASELSLAEAAMLAGLVQSPSSYAPTVSMERAIARRNVVLQAMRERGAIDETAAQSARAQPVALRDTLNSDEPHGRYFKEHVRRELVERFGWQRVYQGGLRVFATIDMDMQKAAEGAVAEGLEALDKRRKTLAPSRRTVGTATRTVSGALLQAALIAMDPESGHVRAMVGGRDFDESSFNRAVQARRQPGSAFKPFVYAAALEAGYTPATMIDNLNAPTATLEGDWLPEEEHSTADSMSLRAALRTSSNRAAVQLLRQVGIPGTVRYAKTMGMGDVPSVPSLALGSGEVTLQAITAAYAAFANHGLVPRSLAIRRVEDRDGRVLYAAEESQTRAISDATAYLMTTMLADVVDAGTAVRARRLGFTLPAAGKTGTTNDFKDAWFIGFTPKIATGVWVGFDQPRTILPNASAGDVAVPLWAAFMKTVTRGDRAQWLSPPRGVTTARVCRLSGQLAGEGCEHVEVLNAEARIERRSMVYTEYFALGTQPTTVCELHRRRGLFRSLSSMLGGGGGPPPPPIAETGLPPEPSRSAEAPPAETADPAGKKRGFWSRFFGLGKNE